MKTYKIDIYPYHQLLHVFVGSDKDIPKTIKRLFGDVDGLKENGFYDCSNLTGLHTYIEDAKTGFKNYVIWLRQAKRNSDDMLTISHEALHCTFRVLDDMGVKLCAESEEAFTYLHEYLTEQIIKKVF